MSESETSRRITAARLARDIPFLLPQLESGGLMLSSLVRIQKHITPQNAEELVAAVRGLTRNQIAELLARRAPRPDVAATLRKLPDARPAAAPSAPLFAAAAAPAPMAARAESAPTPAPLVAPTPERAKLEPLSEARYRLQLTASRELRDKLERAKALMRHRNPSGDLAVIVEAAMDLLVAELERQRLGRRRAAKPAGTSAEPKPDTNAEPTLDTNAEPTPEPTPAKGTAIGTRRAGRYIPRATRRAVFERDGEQCAYVNERGERCPSRTFLEIHHVHAHGRGGTNDLENLQVTCRAHNRLLAEDDFGRLHMDEQRYLRRDTYAGR